MRKNTKPTAHAANGDTRAPHIPEGAKYLKRDDILSNLFGATQPHNADLEQVVLGAVMVDREAFPKINIILKSSDFYVPEHQVIYKAFEALHETNKPIDLLTVVERLRSMNALEKSGGAFALSQFTNMVASSANIEYHAQLVRQSSMRREAIACCAEGLSKLMDPTHDVFGVRNDLVDVLRTPPAELVFDVTTPEEAILRGLREQPSSRLFGDLLRIGQLGIMFAPPGTGKSALAYQMADAAAKGTSLLNVLPNEHAKPMRALIIDFENDRSDLADRYADKAAGTMHQFPENMRLLLLKSDSLIMDDFETKSMHQIEFEIEQFAPEFIILDNLTYLTAESVSDGTVGMRLMKRLLYYQKHSSATLLVLAHSTKRYNKTKPLEMGDYQGAAALAQFTQAMWGLNRSATDTAIVYFKQFKQRKGGVSWDENNVIACTLGKEFEQDPDNRMLRFQFEGIDAEAKHLADFREPAEQDAMIEQAILHKIANPSHGVRKIAEAIQWAQSPQSLNNLMRQYAQKSRQYEFLDGGFYKHRDNPLDGVGDSPQTFIPMPRPGEDAPF